MLIDPDEFAATHVEKSIEVSLEKHPSQGRSISNFSVIVIIDDFSRACLVVF